MVLTTHSFSQNIDITYELRQIEAGNIQKAEASLSKLKSENPSDPSVIFLDAVLTENGEEALKKYFSIYEKYPKSKYADASLYRIFSYYYALGFYKNAEVYLTKLKSEYPNSPYIKIAERNIPSEISTDDANQNRREITSYKFTIQAGAFINLENAKKLSEQLNSEGYDTEITTREIGGSILNIVNVGKFINEEETKTVLSLLEKKFNIKGRVINISN